MATRGVFLWVVNDRMAFARWAELADCLRIKEDLPDYREAYDCEADTPIAGVLAAAMDAYYFEEMPMIAEPFSGILMSAYNDIDWIALATDFLERVK